MDIVRRRSNWLLTGLLLVTSLFVLLPMYFTLITAVKTKTDMSGNLWLPPSEWTWSNFSSAIEVTHFWRALGNSALITVSVVVLAVLTNSLVAYAIARNLQRRRFKVMFFYLLSALFIPFPIVMLPLVKEMSFLGLDNIWGLILLYVVYNLAFNTLLYTGYLQTIPIAIDEAAMLDGAGPWTTFWRVIFPMLMPINATVVILTGLMTWNDFLLPLVILSDSSQYTLPLSQYAFQGQFSTDYNLAFASYLMAMTPMLLVYLVAQRWIIGGVARGSVK